MRKMVQPYGNARIALQRDIVRTYHAYRCNYDAETFAVERGIARKEQCWNNHSANKQRRMWNEELILKKERKGNNIYNSQVNGLIARGDNKLATDFTPAMNPCAFPWTEINRVRP